MSTTEISINVDDQGSYLQLHCKLEKWHYCKISNIWAPNHTTSMILVSSCRYLCPIHWSQVLGREWRCSWSNTDRRCSIYIWMIDKFVAYGGANYIRGLTVSIISNNQSFIPLMLTGSYAWPTSSGNQITNIHYLLNAVKLCDIPSLFYGNGDYNSYIMSSVTQIYTHALTHTLTHPDTHI